MEFPVGEALEEIQSSEFALKMNKADTIDAFVVMLIRDPAVTVLRVEATKQRVWQRLLARLQVLVAAPTIIKEICEEDVAVATLLWLLKDCPLCEIPKRLRLGTIWWWALKMIEKEGL